MIIYTIKGTATPKLRLIKFKPRLNFMFSMEARGRYFEKHRACTCAAVFFLWKPAVKKSRRIEKEFSLSW
jgi:hypothetical protein